ncbi:MAG: leucine-rich repeat domain-containing protein [Holosporales bacterium]|nr:leucine-rich repeat domain-containing protein [Holosporales bacterium]
MNKVHLLLGAHICWHNDDYGNPLPTKGLCVRKQDGAIVNGNPAYFEFVVFEYFPPSFEVVSANNPNRKELIIGLDCLPGIRNTLRCVILPLGATLYDNAFSKCAKLEVVVLQTDSQRIGRSCFSKCTSLEHIYVPDSVIQIGSCAFKGCSKLRYVRLSSKLNKIAKQLFQSCKSLNNVELPAQIAKISDFAFYKCKLLQHISFPQGLAKIGAHAFGYTNLYAFPRLPSLQSIDDCVFLGCTELVDVTFSQSLMTIGSSAFSGCTRLMSVTFPSSLKMIWRYAFHRCTSLTRVTFENPLKSAPELTIYESAFSECIQLASITFPVRLFKIGSRAFRMCYRLKEVLFSNPTKTASTQQELEQQELEVILDTEAFSFCPIGYMQIEANVYLGSAVFSLTQGKSTVVDVGGDCFVRALCRRQLYPRVNQVFLHIKPKGLKKKRQENEFADYTYP